MKLTITIVLALLTTEKIITEAQAESMIKRADKTLSGMNLENLTLADIISALDL